MLAPVLLAISRLIHSVFLKVIIFPSRFLWGKIFSHYKKHAHVGLYACVYTHTYIFAEESIKIYCTVTIEKAAKHIAASIIRKWPHRETFSASSSWRMNL